MPCHPRSRQSAGRGGIVSLDTASTLVRPEHEKSNRLLIVAQELTRGGAAYLALRHAQTLSARYPVDILVTGRCDDDFLCEFPRQIPVYHLDASPIRLESDWPFVLHQFALDHAHALPFRQEYHALLATSVFPDIAACAAVCTVKARRRHLFLVDEGLAVFNRLAPSAQAIAERCIALADLVLPVSRRLWTRMAEHRPVLRTRPWHCLRPPVDAEAIARLAEESQAVILLSDVPSVITVARLSPDKQVPRSLRVHHRLKDAGLRFRWYVMTTSSCSGDKTTSSRSSRHATSSRSSPLPRDARRSCSRRSPSAFP
jgi:hypothetical protein